MTHSKTRQVSPIGLHHRSPREQVVCSAASGARVVKQENQSTCRMRWKRQFPMSTSTGSQTVMWPNQGLSRAKESPARPGDPMTGKKCPATSNIRDQPRSAKVSTSQPLDHPRLGPGSGSQPLGVHIAEKPCTRARCGWREGTLSTTGSPEASPRLRRL